MPWTSSGVTEIAIDGLWTNNHHVVNVLQATHGADVGPAAVARDVLNNWQDHIVYGVMANNYVLQGARYRYRQDVDGETGYLAPNPSKQITGTGTAVTSPPNVAMLVHKRISTTSGRRAGRMYLPPPGEVEIDEDGRLGTAIVAAVTTQLNLFFDGVDDSTEARLVVVHGTGVDSGDKPHSDVTSLTLDPIVATQRRRLR